MLAYARIGCREAGGVDPDTVFTKLPVHLPDMLDQKTVKERAPSKLWGLPAAFMRPVYHVCFLLLITANGAFGLSFTGMALVDAANTATSLWNQQEIRQRYSLSLGHNVSPWLGLDLRYFFSDFSYSRDDGEDFFQRQSQPTLQARYIRGQFSSAFNLRSSSRRGSIEQANLDSRSISWLSSWRPRFGLNLDFQARNEANTPVTSSLGRDSSLTLFVLSAGFSRKSWNLRYDFQGSETSSESLSRELRELRHSLRGDYLLSLAQDRFYLSTSARVSFVDQEENLTDPDDLFQRLRASRGLFAVDTSPDLGSLGPVPSLIDGDVVTPTTPVIDIGAARTFRNIGLDLGVSLPVTRLDLWVAQPSGPSLVWEVYESSDNLTWQRVSGVQSFFDPGFLRYELLIPETTNRYFKAVNLSSNAADPVEVTELEALTDVPGLGRGQRESTDLRFDLLSRYQIHQRVGLYGSVNLQQGASTFAFTQDTVDLSLNGGMEGQLRRDLRFRIELQLNDFERNQEPIISRNTSIYLGSLIWEPIPTVSGLIQIRLTEESEQETALGRNDQAEMRFDTDIRPQLQVSSSLVYTSVSNVFSGIDYSSWQWREGIQSNVLENLLFRGSFTVEIFDNRGSFPLSDRIIGDAQAIWTASPYLQIEGAWTISQETDRRTTNQRYRIGWTPGRKLTSSLSYTDSRTSGTTGTSQAAWNFRYRLTSGFSITSSWAHTSTTLGITGLTDSRSSFRVGIQLNF